MGEMGPLNLVVKIFGGGWGCRIHLFLKTILKTRQDLRSIFKSPGYDDDIKEWMIFGGDNEQFATRENVELCKKRDKLIIGF